MMSHQCYLTTNDNPFNPFEQFIPWLMYDLEKGYKCCERLMRVAKVADNMSQKEINEEIERAIDQIIKYDITHTYAKATKELKDEQETTP